MKLGIFGGSFDPIHYGHLVLADAAREAAQLDRVLFVPAATSPLKPDGPKATDKQRLEMVNLAIGGNPAFELSKIEIERDGLSYTVDTLQALAEQHPEDQRFLIMGSDSLQSLPAWKDSERICQLATPLVGCRHGSSANLDQLADFVDESRLQKIKEAEFPFPIIEFSSTELRRRVAAGESVRYRLPRAVETYIQVAKLYR